MNWSEKYRPKSIEDLYLSYDIKTKLNKWITDFKSKKKNFTNCLILHGPPGIGKTSLANIILNTNDFDIIEFNSSDLRNQKILKEKLSQINGSVNILDFMCQKKKQIGIIIDELDGLHSMEKGSLKELTTVINSTKKYSSPFICTTNSINKKISLLKKKSTYIKINRPTKNVIKKFINHICEKEDINISDTIINLLVQTSQMDFRRIIVLMEYLFNYIDKLDEDKLCNLIENYDKKKLDYTSYEATDKILNNYYKDYSDIVDTDKSNIGYLLYENFQKFIIYNKKCSEKKQLETIASIYKLFSLSDIVDKKIYINQHFYLSNYNNYLKFNMPLYLINKLEKTSYNKFNEINYSTMINKISFEYLNIKLVNVINTLGLSTNHIYNCDYIYSNVKQSKKDILPIIQKYAIDKITLEKMCKLSSFYSKDNATELKKMIGNYYKLL